MGCRGCPTRRRDCRRTASRWRPGPTNTHPPIAVVIEQSDAGDERWVRLGEIQRPDRLHPGIQKGRRGDAEVVVTVSADIPMPLSKCAPAGGLASVRTRSLRCHRRQPPNEPCCRNPHWSGRSRPTPCSRWYRERDWSRRDRSRWMKSNSRMGCLRPRCRAIASRRARSCRPG